MKASAELGEGTGRVPVGSGQQSHPFDAHLAAAGSAATTRFSIVASGVTVSWTAGTTVLGL